jgi:AcrR family transcriptional regulator
VENETMMVVPKVRRTQEERTTAMRARLLDATIECLYEIGYANTTTTEIARRAGVSRGAQLHHFPTKAELVTTAVDYLFQRRTQEFRDAFTRLPPGVDRARAAVELLWTMASGPTFYAWLELMVAARTDPDLRPTVTAMAERFAETVRRTFGELFPRSAPGPFFDIAPSFGFALIQGLALEATFAADRDRVDTVLDVLKALASLAIPSQP